MDVGSGWAGPVVAGEQARSSSIASDDEEVLVCLDPATGKETVDAQHTATKYRDDFGFDDGPRATPTVAAATVFTLGANGDLAAIELASGKQLWHRNIRDDYKADKGFFGVACSPLVIGKKLLVNVGGKGAGVVAFDVTSGKELWKSTDDAASYSSPTAAEIDGKLAAVFLTRLGLRVLDPGQREVAYDFPFRRATQRERAGRDAARLEGRNLPHRLVLHRRGPAPGEEGRTGGSLGQRQVAVEPVQHAGSRGGLPLRHRMAARISERQSALRRVEDRHGEVE